MPDAAPLTEDEVRRFVKDWYDLLDVHAPEADILPLMADDVVFRFPEVTTHGKPPFGTWYDRIVHTFFDEVHTLKNVGVTLTDEGADVDVLVNWQASVWRAPIRNSERIKFDAGQTWKVRRSPDTGNVQLLLYSVDSFVPMEGSANLPVLPREVVTQYYTHLNAGEWDACAALAAPGVSFDVDKDLAGADVELQGVVADGEQVSVVWRSAKVGAEGASYFRVADGKITELRAYRGLAG
jgi:hypothetical protein